MIGPWTAYPGLNHGGTCAIFKRSCSVVYLFVCAVMVREIQHALPSVIETRISLCLNRVFFRKAKSVSLHFDSSFSFAK